MTEPSRPPPAHAAFTAARSVLVAGPPRLSEMTFAPRVCAHEMHAATSELSPEPSASSALQTISGESNARPVIPRPLLASAAIVPATCVPWPWPSAHEPSVTEPRSADAQAPTLPARSSCPPSIPVSTTATDVPPSAGYDSLRAGEAHETRAGVGPRRARRPRGGQ